jgi:hypothetical protein
MVKIIWILAGIIFFIIIIGVIVTILIISNENIINVEQTNNISMSIYLKTLDSNDLIQTSSNFIITDINESIIFQGYTLDSGWTTALVDENSINLCCWDDSHYINEVKKIFTSEDLSNKKVKLECSMNKISEPKLNIIGNLSSDLITLQIGVNNYFKNPRVCESHSAGIINVNPSMTSSTCNSGFWKNTSMKDVYSCGNQLMLCSSVDKVECKLKELYIPERFNNIVDNCYQLGFDLNNESKQFTFKLSTLEILNELDYIRFYVYDNELRYNNGFNIVSEVNNKDIGSPEESVEIDYGN